MLMMIIMMTIVLHTGPQIIFRATIINTTFIVVVIICGITTRASVIIIIILADGMTNVSSMGSMFHTTVFDNFDYVMLCDGREGIFTEEEGPV